MAIVYEFRHQSDRQQTEATTKPIALAQSDLA